MNYFYQLLIGLGSGVFVAWVTTVLALRRFYSEKWWEKRANALIELTDSLYHMKVLQEYYSELKDFHRMGPDDYPGFIELGKEQLKELQVLSMNGRKLMIKYSQVGPLLINEKVSALLSSFLKEEISVDNDVHFRGWDTDEAEEHLLKMIQNLFDDVLKESKKELKAK